MNRFLSPGCGYICLLYTSGLYSEEPSALAATPMMKKMEPIVTIPKATNTPSVDANTVLKKDKLNLSLFNQQTGTYSTKLFKIDLDKYN